MWTQVDTCFSVLSSEGRDTLGKGMVFDLFVLNRVSLSRLIWYARWILFVLQVYKSNNVSLLWRGFCPLSLTGCQNLGCCAKQGMYFRDFCPKQKNQILGGSPMLKWLSTLPPPPRDCHVRIEGGQILTRDPCLAYVRSRIIVYHTICTEHNCAKKLDLEDKL